MSRMSRRQRNSKRAEQTDSEIEKKDTRIPVSVTQIGKWKVTIYDQAAYNQSKLDYPDNPNEKPLPAKDDNTISQFKKSKRAARYNWTSKLDKPLGTVPSEKEESA
jgi:hypothetical protein